MSSQDLQQFLSSRDLSGFSNEPYSRKIKKPWGWEQHFTPDDLGYMGKILHLDEGKRNSLQVHDKKQESYILLRGNVSAMVENSSGELETVELTTAQGFTVAVGQKHRLVGGQGGGDILEVSTPETGTTFRIEDDYSRPDESEELRQERNQEAE